MNVVELLLVRLQRLSVSAIVRASGPLGGIGTNDLTGGIHDACGLILDDDIAAAEELVAALEERWL